MHYEIDDFSDTYDMCVPDFKCKIKHIKIDDRDELHVCSYYDDIGEEEE